MAAQMMNNAGSKRITQDVCKGSEAVPVVADRPQYSQLISKQKRKKKKN